MTNEERRELQDAPASAPGSPPDAAQCATAKLCLITNSVAPEFAKALLKANVTTSTTTRKVA